MIDKVGIKHFHLLDGEQDPAGVIREIGNALQKAPIDVALVGIGENGHLAFNDPPADFETEDPYQGGYARRSLQKAATGRRLVRKPS